MKQSYFLTCLLLTVSHAFAQNGYQYNKPTGKPFQTTSIYASQPSTIVEDNQPLGSGQTFGGGYRYNQPFPLVQQSPSTPKPFFSGSSVPFPSATTDSATFNANLIPYDAKQATLQQQNGYIGSQPSGFTSKESGFIQTTSPSLTYQKVQESFPPTNNGYQQISTNTQARGFISKENGFAQATSPTTTYQLNGGYLQNSGNAKPGEIPIKNFGFQATSPADTYQKPQGSFQQTTNDYQQSLTNLKPDGFTSNGSGFVQATSTAETYLKQKNGFYQTNGGYQQSLGNAQKDASSITPGGIYSNQNIPRITTGPGLEENNYDSKKLDYQSSDNIPDTAPFGNSQQQNNIQTNSLNSDNSYNGLRSSNANLQPAGNFPLGSFQPQSGGSGAFPTAQVVSDDGLFNAGDYSAIPGEAGRDYPIFSDIPETSFDCNSQSYPGYYADIQTRCQAFHVCANGEKYNFLCPNGTIFHQQFFVCVWWNQFDCNTAERYFALNEQLYDYSRDGSFRNSQNPQGSNGPPLDFSQRTPVNYNPTQNQGVSPSFPPFFSGSNGNFPTTPSSSFNSFPSTPSTLGLKPSYQSGREFASITAPGSSPSGSSNDMVSVNSPSGYSPSAFGFQAPTSYDSESQSNIPLTGNMPSASSQSYSSQRPSPPSQFQPYSGPNTASSRLPINVPPVGSTPSPIYGPPSSTLLPSESITYSSQTNEPTDSFGSGSQTASPDRSYLPPYPN